MLGQGCDTARGLLPREDAFKFVVTASGRIELVGLEGTETCNAGVLPSDAQPDAEQELAQSFLDAYDAHDVAGVVRLFVPDTYHSGPASYTDCGDTRGSTVTATGKAAVAAWLRARFADGDSITQPRMLFDSYLSEGTNDPQTVVVRAVRSNNTLARQGMDRESVTIRVVPNDDVSRIRFWQVWSGCTAKGA